MTVVIFEKDDGTKILAKKAVQKIRKKFKKGDIIAKELDRVWRKIRDDAVAICPKDTGALASTIRIVKIPVGMMGGTWSRMKEITIFDRSIVAGDITKMNPKSKRPVDYATWVHDGHKMKDGRMYVGVPFLTLAIAQNEGELNKAIARALKKIGKKYQRGK